MRIGPFIIEELLGKGGMGEVWRAYHEEDQTEVAIKVILRHAAREASYADAFEREIQTIARLNHPAIIELYDYGRIDHEAARQSNGWLVEDTPYLAMELAQYNSLGNWIAYLSWDDIASILFVTLDALSHAHAHGVIHRDLKPQNLLLGFGTRGMVKLTDFGLAHPQFDDSLEGQFDEVWGTPSYMAPEQIRGSWREYGPWTDLYALGCMTYKMISGRLPFEADDAASLWRSHLFAPMPRWRPRIDVPAALEQWVARLLQKSITRRYDFAADAAAALLEIYKNNGGLPLEEGQRALQQKLFELDRGPQAKEAVIQTPMNQLSALNWHSMAAEAETVVIDDTHPSPKRPLLEESLPTEQPRVPRGSHSRAWSEYFDHIQQLEQTLSTPPLPRQTAPLPPTWEKERQLKHRPQLLHTGVHLHQFRILPLIGRRDERDLMWTMLKSTYITNEPHMVVLSGKAGVGKTRLAQWFCARVHELGAAQVMRATYSENVTPLDGLGTMLARQVNVLGLDHKNVQLRLAHQLKQRNIESPERFLALSQILLEHDPHYQQSLAGRQQKQLSPNERYQWLMAHMISLTGDRPLVVWLDDVQWGAEALFFARYVMSQSHAPILFVATYRQTHGHETSLERQLLASLDTLEQTQTINIEPLDDQHFSELVEQLLPLTPELTRQVELRTHGMPLFAIELISHWINNDRLVETPRGFALKPGYDELPVDIHELMQQRISALPQRHEIPLLVAATLGLTVREDEWRQALQRMDIEFGALDLASYERLDLLHKAEDHVWYFSHNMLRESLHYRARELKKWKVINLACAQALAQLYPKPGVHEERLALHYVGAGEIRLALEALYRAAQRRHQRTEVLRALRLLDRHSSLAEHLKLPDESALRLRARLLRAKLKDMQGLYHQSAQDAHYVYAQALLYGPVKLAVEAMVELGWATLHQGKTQEAQVWFEQAYQQVDNEEARLVCVLGLGRVAQRRDALEEARAHYETVRAHPLSQKHQRLLVVCLNGLGDVHRQLGKMEDAKHYSEQALARSLQLGNRFMVADCYTDLAEWYRLQGQYDDALEMANRALPIFDAMESHMRLRASLQVAMILLGQGQIERASEVVEPHLEVLRQTQDYNLLPMMLLVQCPALAMAQQWIKLEDHLETIKACMEKSQRRSHNISWLLSLILVYQETIPDEVAEHIMSLKMHTEPLTLSNGPK